LFLQVKWKKLNYDEALQVIEKLKQKSFSFELNRNGGKNYFGILAKGLERKEKLISKGYFVFDLQDLIGRKV
jgi:hypothetical protein